MRTGRLVVHVAPLLPLLLLSAQGGEALAQSPDGIWRDEAPSARRGAVPRVVQPARFRLLRLSWGPLEARLSGAPAEGAADAEAPLVSLPLPDGAFLSFAIERVTVMAPELAAKFPQIMTYRGQGVEEPTATVRIDRNPGGFHAMIDTGSETVYIDPYQLGDNELHVSYHARDGAAERPADHRCLLQDTSETAAHFSAEMAMGASGTDLRTYDIAMAATGEYTAFHSAGAPTVAEGLAALVTAMNRVNGIYEREVGIRMVLNANNDQIVYTNSATDPYTDGSTSTMLGENQTNLDSVIGDSNYDIGHVVGAAGGGGFASLRTPCRSGRKARGVTLATSPTGDPFWVDFIAHEIGHQWNANHTWNGNAGACSASAWVQSTAMEPGSGSTIMSYSGICGSQNLQIDSDDYFHAITFDEIIAYSTTGLGNTCGSVTSTGNGPPVPNAGSDFTIPIGTPFTLCGSATDPESNPMTYGWEQFNVGTQQTAPNSPVGDAPIFRSFDAVTSPCRTFPKLSDILNNTQTLGEILPTYSRVMTFRLTVRDNHIGGGGVGNAEMNVTVTDGAGPFLVTAPNTAVSWNGGANETTSWDVANTDTSTVNCSSVDVDLSLDGGLTYANNLLTATPNDGSQSIVVPAVNTTEARVKVQCNGNIFFDVSNTNFTIVGGSQPTVSIDSVSVTEGDAGTVNAAFTVSLTAAADASVNFATSNDTATAGSDYLASSNTLNFSSSGPTTQTLNIVVNGDTTDETDETFFVTLTSPVGANISPTNGQGTGTILDDDPTIPTDLVLTNDTVTETQSFLATNSITAGPSYVIQGDATFTAGALVILRSGFSVASNGVFKIIIDPGL